MKYDFTTRIDRMAQNSSKWIEMRKICPEAGKDIVPLSVADMELKNPPEITEGLKKFLDDRILGYTLAGDDYYEETIRWMERRHQWKIEKDWIVLLPGVVTALNVAVRAFVRPKEKILILTPVYHPFQMTIERCGCQTVSSKLINDHGYYSIDFEDLDRKLSDPEVKMMIFCSPHNPIGRVWTVEELKQVACCCEKHDVLLISDEIHSDLILPGYHHTMMASLNEPICNKMITCTSVSKTFNLAGIQCSNIIIPDEKMRKKYLETRDTLINNKLNIFAYEAATLAYRHCEGWLDELLQLLDINRKVAETFFAQHFPKAVVSPLQGTYLLWVDMNPYFPDIRTQEEFMTTKAFFFVDEGSMFGEEGNGFERINLACPTSVLSEALNRLAEAYRTQ